jgi:hypothetical protein
MRHIYWKITYKRVLFGTYMTDEKPHPFCFDRRIFIMIATQSTHFSTYHLPYVIRSRKE